ncbi:unnamed protein product, partial [marine sediment metagenome]
GKRPLLTIEFTLNRYFISSLTFTINPFFLKIIISYFLLD